MATGNLDSADLKAVADGGLVNEDVMNSIWDISHIPLPWTEMLGSPDAVHNSNPSWTQDKLQAIDITNALVDGADAGTDDSNTGLRVNNHCQISGKWVFVSTRARNSKVIGQSDSLSYNVMMRQRELRRDVDAIMQGQQASIADDGAAVPGKSAGFGAWLTTSTDRGATGTDGGYGATSPNIVDAPGAGTVRAIDEQTLRDMAQSVFEAGGNVTKLFTTPSVKRSISEYFYTDAAKVATLDSDVGQAQDQATAKGAVDVFVSDFAVLELIASRTMQLVTTDNANVYLVDPEFVRQGLLHGYRTEELAKTGLADKRQMIVDWTLKVLNEEAHAVIADINGALPMLAVPA
jgi:hypothetical protein